MARYTGPKTKIARKFGEAIFGEDKNFEKRNYPPGQHGNARRRGKKSEYATKLKEKQKAKYTYSILERQIRNLFKDASSSQGITGEILLQLCEYRLDNVVYRMGVSKSRSGARQLVSHKHIVINGIVNNIPSAQLHPGDVISVRGKSQGLLIVEESINANKNESKKFGWIEFTPSKMSGKFLEYPERENIPENINEQLIVELYSK